MAGFDRRLYACWIIANGWSELIGLGGTILLGFWIVTQTGEPSSAFSIVATALLAVLGGTALGGGARRIRAGPGSASAGDQGARERARVDAHQATAPD